MRTSRLLLTMNAMQLTPAKAIAALAIVAVALSLPIFVRGSVLVGQDTHEHINFGRYFAEQFWQGDIYPRWLQNMNYGLGSASFFVYPPFPSYVYALLLPLARIVHLDAFSLGEYLCLFASGLCAFFWMTTMVSTRVSLVAAVLYMLLPYHLAIDFYRRGALSECWALAWMPLVLYFTTQVARNKRYATIGLALSYALLIVSHLVSVFILSALPLLLVLTIAERGRKARAFFAVVGSLVLGAAISGAYLVPAFANAKYFPVPMLQIPIDNGPQGNLLVYGWPLLTGHSGKSGFVQAISIATVDTALFIALCGFIALQKGPPSRRAQALLWLAVCPIPLFLMSGPSHPIWTAVPALATAVQFPWRFDVVLCIAALPLAAFVLDCAFALPARSRAAILIIITLFAATWFGAYVDVVRRLALEHNNAATSATTKLSVHDGWFAAWTPHGMDQDSALAASAGPAVKFLTGDGAATVLIWKPRHIEVLTDCTTCGPLMIRQLYYPKWKAQLVPNGQSLPVEPALPQGLTAVHAPPGRQHILVEMPRGLDEQIGNSLSASGIFVCGVLAVFRFARPASSKRTAR
jgi:hypothetical protein